MIINQDWQQQVLLPLSEWSVKKWENSDSMLFLLVCQFKQGILLLVDMNSFSSTTLIFCLCLLPTYPSTALVTQPCQSVFSKTHLKGGGKRGRSGYPASPTTFKLNFKKQFPYTHCEQSNHTLLRAVAICRSKESSFTSSQEFSIN